jgi:DNA-binding transcriptional ArsR family regulator
MSGSDLPEPVRRLIVACIGSAADLEILLLLHRSPERSWGPRDVDSELRLGEASARAGLQSLTEAGLVKLEDEKYRFAPGRDQRRAVDELAEAYARRRVRVIEFLYSKPSDRITLFSDAFRLRRPKD